VSLVDAVRGPCAFCDGSAEEIEAISATYDGRCPGCGADLEPVAREVDLVRFDVEEIDWRGGGP